MARNYQQETGREHLQMRRRLAPLIMLISLFGLLGLASPSASAGGQSTGPDRARPSQVRNLEVEAGDMSLMVSWDAPERTGPRGITSYSVAVYALYGPGSGGPATLAALSNPSNDSNDSNQRRVQKNLTCSTQPSERTCTLRGLENETTYQVEVFALNRRGPGPSVRTTGTPMAAAQPRRIVVEAYGERGEEEFEVRIGTTVVGQATTTTEYERYEFEAAAALTGPITVAFTNDYYDGWQIDRNLWVNWVGIGQLQPRYGDDYDDGYDKGDDESYDYAETASAVAPRHGRPGGPGADSRLFKIHSDQPNVYSEGAWANGDGCSPGFKKSKRITCGGIFTYGVIDDYGQLTDAQDPYLPELAPDEADPDGSWLKVRARGTVGGERFAVRIDGSAEILAQMVVTREWRTYRIPVGAVDGKPVIGFMNDMDNNVHDFNLMVDWMSLDNVRVEAEHPSVWVSATGGCESGNIQTDTMYCNGSWWFPAMSNV